MFKENELDIVIRCNMKIENYFDVTPNLKKIKLIALTKKRIIKQNTQTLNLTTHHLDFHHHPNRKKSLTTLLSYTKHKLKYKTNTNTSSYKKQQKRNIILVQTTVQQKSKNQYKKNISKSIKETLSTTLLVLRVI